jgi:carbamoyltransferase
VNILGLHFGHDAAVCVLRDGQVAAYVLRERYSRHKHAISLEVANIQAALDDAGLRAEEIDYCALTSTQNIELIIDDSTRFGINFETHPGHTAPCSMAELMRVQGIDLGSLLICSLLNIFYEPRLRDTHHFRSYDPAFPEHRDRPRAAFANWGWIDQQIHSDLWPGLTLEALGRVDFSPVLANDVVRHGFHFPVTVQLAGRAVPGYYVGHHAAHAASSFYQSGFAEAAILTHDGFGNGLDCLAGLFFWGEGRRIFPVTPHHLALGGLYEDVGVRLGLGDVGAPGKLMGLAAYGQPRFFDREFVGNWYDWQAKGISSEVWWAHCLRLASEMGYDLAPLGDSRRATSPINVDIAASTQKLLEESYLAAVEALHKILGRTGRRTHNLCLSGGTALNCPSNSRIFREGRFRHLFIEPGCDDSGLAIGAATFLHHNVLDQPRPAGSVPAPHTPYLGAEISASQIREALEAAAAQLEFTPCPDAATAAAEDLASDRIVGWFEGRSEIGPRALGHRSILADPRHGENWRRVNRIKGREEWRPFAPAVLESEADRWFLGMPNPSPSMLFTATVRSTAVPAITHHDGSARLQTVNASNGEFFRVIEQFFARTGVPMVLNTSFNGPGEPIVETPREALAFLVHSGLDVLYLGGFRVVRRAGAAGPG